MGMPRSLAVNNLFKTNKQKIFTIFQGVLKQGVPDVRLRESVAEALGAVVYTYSRKEGQEEDKVHVALPSVRLASGRANQKKFVKSGRLTVDVIRNLVPETFHIELLSACPPQGCIPHSALTSAQVFSVFWLLFACR